MSNTTKLLFNAILILSIIFICIICILNEQNTKLRTVIDNQKYNISYNEEILYELDSINCSKEKQIQYLLKENNILFFNLKKFKNDEKN